MHASTVSSAVAAASVEWRRARSVATIAGCVLAVGIASQTGDEQGAEWGKGGLTGSGGSNRIGRRACCLVVSSSLLHPPLPFSPCTRRSIDRSVVSFHHSALLFSPPSPPAVAAVRARFRSARACRFGLTNRSIFEPRSNLPPIPVPQSAHPPRTDGRTHQPPRALLRIRPLLIPRGRRGSPGR